MARERKTDRQSPRTEQEKLDEILALISDFGWTLGYFLLLLFSNFRASEDLNNPERTSSHSRFVSFFLSGASSNTNTSLQNILTAIYNHPDSSPTQTRAYGSNSATPVNDHTPMARHQMLLWSVIIVRAHIVKEATSLARATAGLHLPIARQDWETVMQFSVQTLRNCILLTAPVLYSSIVSVATSPNASLPTAPGLMGGLESSRSRDPKIVSVVVILMMVVSRNMRANFFQKVIGVWLFACSAPAHIYRVLCRVGLSVSYNTVLYTLRQLSQHSIESTKRIAAKLQFLIIFDNINRQRKFWTPSLGQQDQIMSGTAATLVELTECSPDAFDPQPVIEAQKKQLRLALTPEILYDRINQSHLSAVMALHCLNFLILHCPSLSRLSGFIIEQLRTTYAIHRMPDNIRTKTHPLSSSSINEGSAAGCRDVLNDILLRQLKLPENLVNSILIIVGGDLATIEKIRALKTLENSCPHGYPSFSWVIPLVQLWHMGWADLARIINNYWGKPATSDPSSLWYTCGLLGRKVKPGVRPEYYPALALVFDTLKADVLDCWRLILDTDHLNNHFLSLEEPPSGPQLLLIAQQLVLRWASTHAHDIAMFSNKYWEGPNKKTLNPSEIQGFRGDHCLANSILRMRDSLWHFEFNWAVADGDIGRVMQIMSVWQFTFVGGSKGSKYATELLELAAGFLYEYPEALQHALMNNWPCNLSGLPGCWFPMDLMQEHNIRELKDKSQKRDEDFDSPSFQHIVSRNVRWFSQVRSVVNSAVDLHDRSSAHGSKQSEGAANRLRTSLEREHVHYFIAGRSFGWTAKDNFMDGYDRMPAKLARFLRRNIGSELDLDDLEDSEPLFDETNTQLLEMESAPEIPAPSMFVAGQFLPGDVLDGLLDDEQLLNALPVESPEY
ncbi:hypothetical protein BDV93DRAFT_572129 [Ceratobasidium sp. AG-I]|nr:hypothetical protein BDV93DRAFT_572129 [Ceratobasidium sp. AG-I]